MKKTHTIEINVPPCNLEDLQLLHFPVKHAATFQLQRHPEIS